MRGPIANDQYDSDNQEFDRLDRWGMQYVQIPTAIVQILRYTQVVLNTIDTCSFHACSLDNCYRVQHRRDDTDICCKARCPWQFCIVFSV